MARLRAISATAAIGIVAATILLRRRRRRLQLLRPPGLIFTGTGCSSGLPLTGCTLGQEWAPASCRACRPALLWGPSDPNWRGNVGALIRFTDADGMERLVQIDCGKTFREITAMRVYRQHGVKSIDAVLLTHDHADAVGGLDELRSLQPYSQTSFEVGNPIRLVCDRRTLSRCRHMFPYLFPAKRKPALTFAFDGGAGICQACELDIEPGPGGEAKPALTRGDVTAPAAPAAAAEAAPAAPVVKRFVAKIEWESFGDAADLKRQVSWVEFFGLQLRRSEAQTSDEQAGLCSGSHSSRAPWRRSVACMPVMHGADYVCFGFGFGPRGGRCVHACVRRHAPRPVATPSSHSRAPF